MTTCTSGRMGFVLSASPEARMQGVCDGMTVRHAGRYCPSAIFLPVDWDLYRDASERMLDVLTTYSPLLEPQGLNRAYLDVTGSTSLFGEPRIIAGDIHRKIQEEIGIAPSIGISGNKLISSAVTTKCKPGKTSIVPPSREGEFLAPLDIRILPGIGEKIEKKLHVLGIHTIGELASISEATIVRQFGVVGSKLHKSAQGIDHTPVLALYPPNDISISHRFDLACGACEPELADHFILRMCEVLSNKLKNRNQRTGCVSLELEFESEMSCCHAYTPKTPTSSTDELHFISNRLFRDLASGAGITAISITAADLKSAQGVQLNLLDDSEQRWRLNSILQSIQSKFGERAVVKGSALTAAG